MGDQFERFITENRELFETEVPSDMLWGKIHNRSKKKDYSIYWKVAAIIMMVSTLILLIDRNFRDVESSEMAQVEISEFQTVEQYYNQMIAERKVELLNTSNTQLRKEFLTELDLLDQKYQELKKTYLNQNSSEMLTDAMINNLRIRLELLNQQLRILQNLKEHKNEKPISEI